MGFGKFVLGGVCAVGAVIAAPVVVPAATIALATSPITGAAGLAAAETLLFASSTSVAVGAAAVGGAAGMAAGAAQEKKVNNAYNQGYSEGCSDAGKEYELKLKKQEEVFQGKINELKKDAQEKDKLIDLYEVYIEELEREKVERKRQGENTIDLEAILQKRRNELENIKTV